MGILKRRIRGRRKEKAGRVKRRAKGGTERGKEGRR